MHASALDRRDFLRTGASLALGAAALAPDHLGARQHADEGPPASAQEALHRLLAGNERFVRGRPRHPHEAASWRRAIAKGQRPFATVIGCADSRVPPEVLFDQGLGNLFVTRVAGNTADDAVLGSLEYAVEHLGVNLIVVLGHERCGAVQAAVKGGEAGGHLGAVLRPILPAIASVHGQPGDAIENAAQANVRGVVTHLSASLPVLAARVKEGTLKVVGARYDLDTGKVTLLQ